MLILWWNYSSILYAADDVHDINVEESNGSAVVESCWWEVVVSVCESKRGLLFTYQVVTYNQGGLEIQQFWDLLSG